MTRETRGRPGPGYEDLPDTLEGWIAWNVIRIRKRHGWSVDDLAEKAGMSRANWYKLESGQYPRLARLNFDRAAEALGVRPEVLLQTE